MSSPVEVPLQSVLQELCDMGMVSDRDVQMATMRVGARVLQEQVQDLTRRLTEARSNSGQ